ncbi:MAG TPA: tetraacyldisaccharide 4'-kinase [Geobacteraceae bacterium]
MKAKPERYFRELWDGKRHKLVDRLMLFLLTLCSIPYELTVRFRAHAYAIGLLPSRRLPLPVVSVGNLTVGGTGKTPAVAMLARFFMARGKRVAVLSRGYGGSLAGKEGVVSDGTVLLLTPQEAGDEPCLLAATNPGLMVVVGADRYRAGLMAMERLAPDIFILDDGYQHLRLKRDLNILLLDSGRPFGNGRVLPAGLLREPRVAGDRADLIIYTRSSEGEDTAHFPGKPACRAFHHLVGVTLNGGELRPLAELKGLDGVAFAGIANPTAFFSDLAEEGLTLADAVSFPDHCRYGEREIARILGAAAACGADYLITTAKDAVKLGAYRGRLPNLYTAALEMWVADPGHLVAHLEKLI